MLTDYEPIDEVCMCTVVILVDDKSLAMLDFAMGKYRTRYDVHDLKIVVQSIINNKALGC